MGRDGLQEDLAAELGRQLVRHGLSLLICRDATCLCPRHQCRFLSSVVGRQVPSAAPSNALASVSPWICKARHAASSADVRALFISPCWLGHESPTGCGAELKAFPERYAI